MKKSGKAYGKGGRMVSIPIAVSRKTRKGKR
jgi:hypothetical protein